MLTPEPVVERVYRKLGGRAILGKEVTCEADLAKLVRGRFALRVLAHLKKQGGFSNEEIARLVIAARTQRHRRAKKQPLTVEESDRVVRLARIQSIAEDVFGDAERANSWLREKLGILDHNAPLDLAQTESGARVVEQILAKIDWGAAA
jgi:putative toxin-antitoxin system antitoxin component (TIGR02293 family)